jgi:hypothetical protein
MKTETIFATNHSSISLVQRDTTKSRMETKFIAVKVTAHGISFKMMVSVQDAQQIKDIIILEEEDVFIAQRLCRLMLIRDGASKSNSEIGRNSSRLEIMLIVLAQGGLFLHVQTKMTHGSMFTPTLL